MSASTTPAELESQRSDDRPPAPAATGYERAIDRDISGYSPLKRLGHYLYVYTRCIFGLIWIFVSGFFAKDATAAIEDFWENYVPHEYKKRHLVISWHAWFLWFTFDFIFDTLFAAKIIVVRVVFVVRACSQDVVQLIVCHGGSAGESDCRKNKKEL